MIFTIIMIIALSIIVLVNTPDMDKIAKDKTEKDKHINRKRSRTLMKVNSVDAMSLFDDVSRILHSTNNVELQADGLKKLLTQAYNITSKNTESYRISALIEFVAAGALKTGLIWKLLLQIIDVLNEINGDEDF